MTLAHGPSNAIVTAIVPCHDSEGTVGQAIDSALAQSLHGVEIIAVDDGSTDGTLGILRKYAQRYPEGFRILRQDHGGPYLARNLAAAHARGRFLAFLDSDDLWEPRKLERQIHEIEARPNSVLCHTGGRVISADGSVIRVFPAAENYCGRCWKELLVMNRLATSSVVVRRSSFEQANGFDETFPARGDWELWTRLARTGELVSIDEPLIRYRLHEGRMSQGTDRMLVSHLRVIDKNARAYRDLVPDLERYIRKSRFAAHLMYGSEYLGAGRSVEARRQALRALRLNPWSLRPWKLLARALGARPPTAPHATSRSRARRRSIADDGAA